MITRDTWFTFGDDTSLGTPMYVTKFSLILGTQMYVTEFSLIIISKIKVFDHLAKT